MAVSVFMPKAGMMMETGRVGQWFKQEGDRVQADEPLLEIETDKACLEIEAPASGVLLKIIHPAGSVTPVAEVLAWIGRPGEKIGFETAEAPVQKWSRKHSPSEPIPVDAQTRRVGSFLGRIPATPLAKTLAARRGIDLGRVKPSGPRGVVQARDVLALPQDRGAQ